MSRWAISSDSIHGTIRFAIVGGTAVDFGTAHVIHRSVIHPAHRSSELPSQIGAEREGERFNPQNYCSDHQPIRDYPLTDVAVQNQTWPYVL